ncbi:class I SAM-dependent methyltransferase [Halobacterium litoreum]|uniref:Class I SAM-dependent methyltransferase n=1 Tax=Halobacterium litoreum TaxID=2039234 RepID=A0ABD5NB28_9EURY|nr:class I SAM-dependent methyltransferase [Halobacterium litoreum]
MSARRHYPVSKPAAYAYDAAYHGVPNWDIGRPQRAFVAAEEAGLLGPRVLDVGCGTGELSLFLARREHDVLGVDLSPLAIRQAREKARWRRIRASFVVWDALDLPRLAARGFAFDSVVDCAMFHVLGAAERDRFVAGLGSVLEPGGTYCVLGDARSDPRSLYGVSPAEIRERFRERDGWRVAFVRETTFERRHSHNPAYFACVVRTE